MTYDEKANLSNVIYKYPDHKAQLSFITKGNFIDEDNLSLKQEGNWKYNAKNNNVVLEVIYHAGKLKSKPIADNRNDYKEEFNFVCCLETGQRIDIYYTTLRKNGKESKPVAVYSHSMVAGGLELIS